MYLKMMCTWGCAVYFRKFPGKILPPGPLRQWKIEMYKTTRPLKSSNDVMMSPFRATILLWSLNHEAVLVFCMIFQNGLFITWDKKKGGWVESSFLWIRMGFFFSVFPSFFLNYRYSEVKSCSVERKLLIMHLEVVMKLIWEASMVIFKVNLLTSTG